MIEYIVVNVLSIFCNLRSCGYGHAVITDNSAFLLLYLFYAFYGTGTILRRVYTQIAIFESQHSETQIARLTACL